MYAARVESSRPSDKLAENDNIRPTCFWYNRVKYIWLSKRVMSYRRVLRPLTLN